jgi:hypothetical protein
MRKRSWLRNPQKICVPYEINFKPNAERERDGERWVHVLFTSLASPALVLAKVVIKRTAHSLLYGRWGPRNQIAQLFIATQKPSQIDLMKGGSPTLRGRRTRMPSCLCEPQENKQTPLPAAQPRNLQPVLPEKSLTRIN